MIGIRCRPVNGHMPGFLLQRCGTFAVEPIGQLEARRIAERVRLLQENHQAGRLLILAQQPGEVARVHALGIYAERVLQVARELVEKVLLGEEGFRMGVGRIVLAPPARILDQHCEESIGVDAAACPGVRANIRARHASRSPSRAVPA
jgi:hypothetical protein